MIVKMTEDEVSKVTRLLSIKVPVLIYAPLAEQLKFTHPESSSIGVCILPPRRPNISSLLPLLFPTDSFLSGLVPSSKLRGHMMVMTTPSSESDVY